MTAFGVLGWSAQLGTDAFGMVAGKLEFVAAEQAAWRELSVSTDFDE